MTLGISSVSCSDESGRGGVDNTRPEGVTPVRHRVGFSPAEAQGCNLSLYEVMGMKVA